MPNPNVTICPECNNQGISCGYCNGRGFFDCPLNPTTVRGWLETLPEPLRERALSQMEPSAPNDAQSLQQAIRKFCTWGNTNEGQNWWNGVYCYCGDMDEPINDGMKEGYNAAKAAYGAMGLVAGLPPIPVKPMAQPIETAQGFDLSKHQILYVSVTHERLAELEEKAAKWDELQETLRRLKIC